MFQNLLLNYPGHFCLRRYRKCQQPFTQIHMVQACGCLSKAHGAPRSILLASALLEQPGRGTDVTGLLRRRTADWPCTPPGHTLLNTRCHLLDLLGNTQWDVVKKIPRPRQKYLSGCCIINKIVTTANINIITSTVKNHNTVGCR